MRRDPCRPEAAPGLPGCRHIAADPEGSKHACREDPIGASAPGEQADYDPAMAVRQSAGILLFRRRDSALEVLLAHPGGPFFESRDAGHWTIPKGEPDPDDVDLLAVARREFREEVGSDAGEAPDGSTPIELGTVTQQGGKVVHAWAVEGDLEPADSVSNTFEMEWPPRSGRRETFPEIDRVAWFAPDEARTRLKPTQIPFVERLLAALESTAVASANPDGT
jgi:predicted NUDIX family NTP pyrophosphohydrolase